MTLCKVEMSFSWWVHVPFQGCMIQWSLHWVKIPLTRIPCSQTCFETKDHDSSWRTQTYFLWQHTNNIRRILQLVGGFNFSLFPTIEMWWWSGFSDRLEPPIYEIGLVSIESLGAPLPGLSSPTCAALLRAELQFLSLKRWEIAKGWVTTYDIISHPLEIARQQFINV